MRRLLICGMLNKIALIAIVGLCPLFQNLYAAENAALVAALNSITTEDLSRHVEVLADDTFEGREAGSRGGRAAGGYLTKEMAKVGLQPAGVDGGWYQPFYDNQRNILGKIPGSDPKLKDEVILISAHYDHVGYGSSTNSFGPIGYIHNGADDNASGVSGVLEVAQAFQTMGKAPRRTVVFALWDGEERGLLGSRHWLSQPTFPLKNLCIAVNIDMIGRLREKKVDIAGTRSSWGLRKLVSQQMGDQDLVLDFNWELKSNSDHWPFYERGFPILMLHTGLHDDYHRPSDDPEKLNREGMQEVSRFLFRLTLALADADEIGSFRAASRTETPAGRRRLEHVLPPDPPRLGITWPANAEGPGLPINRVVAGSAADQAGLRVGDRLLKVGDEEITSGAQLRSVLVTAGSPVSCLIMRAGVEEPEEVAVALGGSPSRVGISWRSDEAEPDSVLIVRIVPGSLAYDAGLKTGDRLYEVGGKIIKDSPQLAETLKTTEGDVDLLVERNGKIQPVSIHLPLLTDDSESFDSETEVPAADISGDTSEPVGNAKPDDSPDAE